jgi:uronate dehydrogenase
MMHILITGAAGKVGHWLTEALGREHELRLGDVTPIAGEPRFVPLDVTQPQQVHEAMQGIDAVVHLAIASGHEGDYEDDAFNQRRFDVNVRGTYNVLQAAVRAGVRRFVHTSSIMVVWGYNLKDPVESDAPARPVGTYALTKQLAEVACAQMARQHGLSLVCLRIAKPIDPHDATLKSGQIRPQWIPFPDLTRAYRCALAAPNIGFEIVTIVGESSRRRFDLSKAERVLGYRPSMRLEDLGFTLGDEREPFDHR